MAVWKVKVAGQYNLKSLVEWEFHTHNEANHNYVCYTY